MLCLLIKPIDTMYKEKPLLFNRLQYYRNISGLWTYIGFLGHILVSYSQMHIARFSKLRPVQKGKICRHNYIQGTSAPFVRLLLLKLSLSYIHLSATELLTIIASLQVGAVDLIGLQGIRWQRSVPIGTTAYLQDGS